MNDILSAIDNFINNRMYNYAVLINGSWGSGKTFFVQNVLMPHLKESGKKDVNYISLYGIRSSDEIGRTLCMKAVKDKLGDVGKLLDKKGSQVLTSIVSAAAKIGLSKAGANDISLEDIVTTLPNYDNNVIIFDDLERCCCDINEVLGYINNFVEHSDAYVILVANEDEIGKWQFDRNPEMQMLLALDKRIDVEVEPTDQERIREIVRQNQKQAKVPRDIYTLEQLDQKRKAIFQGNDKYRRFKEKVIGQTVNYDPDLKSIFTTIVNDKVSLPILKESLLLMIDAFVKIATSEKHNNIRTFQFFLEKSHIIFDFIQEDYPTLRQTLLLYAYHSSVRYMKGIDLPNWEGDYGNIFFGKRGYSSEQVMGFKFIDDLIGKNFLDKEYISKVLTQFSRLAEQKGQLTKDPYQKLDKWYLATDAELRNWLDEIEDNIKTGRYSTALYTDLLNRLSNLLSYGIMVAHCNSIIDAMKDYIKESDPSMIEELEQEFFINEGEAEKIYKKHRSEIDSLIIAKKNQSEQLLFNKALDNDTWGSQLLQLTKFMIGKDSHSFIYWLDPQTLSNKIKNSNNAELQQFRFAMQHYYDSTPLQKASCDSKHLESLKTLLENTNMEGLGEIHRNYYHWIVGDINRYLERLKSQKNIEEGEIEKI